MHAWLLVVCCFLVFPGGVRGLEPSEVFKKVSPSVVVVRSVESDQPGVTNGSQGSGVVIAPGVVITNFHVVNHAPFVHVEYEGNRYPAKVQYADLERDLCQLLVEKLIAPPIERISYKDLNTGDKVFAIGTPQGLELTLSQGLVSSIRKKGESVLIQTSAAISQGSSGGGLFDEEGRLAGITTLMVTTGQNLNFAVPADWIGEIKERSQVEGPEEGDFLLQIGQHTRKQEHEKVIEVANRWLEKVPDRAVAHSSRGDARLALRRYDAAALDYQKIFTLKGYGFEGLRMASFKGLGEAYAFLHRYHAAIKAFQQFIDLVGEREEKSPQMMMLVVYSLEKMAFCYQRLGDFSRSIELLEKVAKIFPGNPSPIASIGRVHAWAGNPSKALESFQQAIQMLPGNPNIYFEMGRAHSALKDSDAAIENYRKAKGTDPWTGLALKRLGMEYLRSQRREEALTAFQEAISARPSQIEVWGEIGKLLLQKKNFSGAESAFERFLELDSEDSNSWGYLGRARLEKRSYSKAEEALHRSTVLEPGEATNWYFLGLARAKQKNLAGAIEALEEAVQRKPRNPTMLYKLGVLCVAKGDRGRVQSLIRSLKDLNRKAALNLKKRAMARGLFKGRKG